MIPRLIKNPQLAVLLAASAAATGALLMAGGSFSSSIPAPTIAPPAGMISPKGPKTPGGAAEKFSRLPIYFEPNMGQTSPDVAFLVRGAGYQTWIKPNEAIIRLSGQPPADAHQEPPRMGYPLPRHERRAEPSFIRMKIEGAAADAKVEGLEKLPGISNYFIGHDPSKWRTHIPQFAKTRIRDLYQGIDLMYYGSQRRLEYDFVVKPQADPSAIRLAYEGVEKLWVDSAGDLILQAECGARLRQHKPRVFQEQNGARREVDAGYRITANGGVTFALAAYDRSKTLVIDPVLEYASFLGGSLDEAAWALALDTQGNAYVTGGTMSIDLRAAFPNAPGFQTSRKSSFSGEAASNNCILFKNSNCDAFLIKINSTGTQILYATYLGGNDFDFGWGVAVDSGGNAFVAGETWSRGGSLFPTAGTGAQTTSLQAGAGFLAQLNSAGTGLVYSTYVSAGAGGTNVFATSLRVGANTVYLLGNTDAGFANIPTPNGYNSANGRDAFVARFAKTSPVMQQVRYVGTVFDDTAWSLDLDPQENIYVAGFYCRAPGSNCSDAPFALKLSSSLQQSWINSFFSGSGASAAWGIAVTSIGDAYVVGDTGSPNIGADTSYGNGTGHDAFVALLSGANGSVKNLAYFGGSAFDGAFSVAVDQFDTAYIAGRSQSDNFPVTFGDTQVRNGGGFDNVIFRVKPRTALGSGLFPGFSLLFSSYFGGPNDEFSAGVHLDSAGGIYFTGVVYAAVGSPSVLPSSKTPSIQPPGGGNDAYVAKLAAAQLKVAAKGYWILDTTGFYTYVADVALSNIAGATIESFSTGYRSAPPGTSASCAGCTSGLALTRTNVPAGAAPSRALFRLAYTSSPTGAADSRRSAERAAFNLPPGTPPTPPEIGTTTDSPVVPPDIPTPPRPVSCSPGFNSSTVQVTRDGGTFSIPVTGMSDGCGWFLKDTGSFINPITDNSAQSQDSPLQFFVPANSTTNARSATITIRAFDEAVLTVNQDGICAFSVTPAPVNNFFPGGGPITFTVTATAGCAWSTTSIPSFLTATTATSGTGSGSVSFNVQANGTSTRSSTITIAGQTIPISQLGTGGAPTGLRFLPIPSPCRVMETRTQYNFEGRTGSFGPPALTAGETRTLNLPVSNVCGIPSTAKAYVVNVTLIPTTTVNFVTVWPAGETRPNTWTIRSTDGQIVANSAIVKAGANGGISVFTSDRADVLIDISGYYTDAVPTALVYYPLTPCRVIDTRILYRSPAGAFGPPSMNRGQTRTFRFPATPYCSVPSAAAYSVTITVAPPAPLAYLTAWPSFPDGSGQPNVSSINSFVGRTLANNVIIPAGSDGSINVFTYDATDFLMDINGFYAPDDGTNRGLFYFPVTQCRASDSTVSGGQFADDTARTINIPSAPGCSGIPSSAQGYAINVTALPNNNPMPFITAYPTGQPRPNASILNAFQGQVVSNAAIIPAGTNGAIDIYAYRRTDIVVEVSGYFGR